VTIASLRNGRGFFLQKRPTMTDLERLAAWLDLRRDVVDPDKHPDELHLQTDYMFGYRGALSDVLDLVRKKIADASVNAD
jgi:hypothetical protein